MENRGREKRGKLAGRIIGIVLLLVAAGILEVILGAYLFGYYRKQTKQIEDSIALAYFTEMNQIFHHVNEELSYMIYDGSEFERIIQAYANSPGGVLGTVEQTQSVYDLKNTFQRLGNTYNSNLNFFYYDRNNEKLIEIGKLQYADRKEFCDLLNQDIISDTIPHSREGKWFLYKDKYICTIVRGKCGYAGCWMLASDFADGIMKLSAENDMTVELYTPKTNTSYIRQRSGSGELSVHTGEALQENGGYKTLLYADFVVGITIKQPFYTGKLLLQIVFTVIMLGYLFVVVLVLWYVRNKILGQVNHFYENLLHFSEQYAFNEDSEIVEFADAGKLMNALADEIRRLKIDMYEKELERQQVELDYAQLQIRPHFYINCLNVIYSMAQTGRNREIQEIALQVSRYLRYIFKRSMKPVTLGSELEFVENYLKVQTSMSGLPYTYDVSMEEELSDCEIPPLLLQTFVENSVKHTADMEDEFSVWITVVSKKQEDGDYILIEICDSGTGIPDELCEQMNNGIFQESDESYHVGIRNAVKRTQMLYGERASIHFGRNDRQGAGVTIQVPDRRRCEDEDTAGR